MSGLAITPVVTVRELLAEDESAVDETVGVAEIVTVPAVASCTRTTIVKACAAPAGRAARSHDSAWLPPATCGEQVQSVPVGRVRDTNRVSAGIGSCRW